MLLLQVPQFAMWKISYYLLALADGKSFVRENLSNLIVPKKNWPLQTSFTALAKHKPNLKFKLHMSWTFEFFIDNTC